MEKGTPMSKALTLSIPLGVGLALTVAAVLLFAALPSLGEERVPAQDAALVNGGFEGEYEGWEGSDERKIAPGWSLWYYDEGSGYDLPKAAESADPRREGDKSQHMWQEKYVGYDACLYQQVGDLTAGHYIRFSAWAKVDADSLLDSPEKWRTMVGIDPDGGTNPKDINHYENPALWDIYTDIGEWQHLSVVMKATSPTVTVYACAHPSLPRRLDVWWDEATFTMTPESLVYLPLLARDHCWFAPGTLANPDLEKDCCILKGYQLHPGYSNVFVAPYWHAFWNDDYDPGTGENKQPEYNYTDRSYRVHSGEVAQQFGLSGGGAFEAGIYQVATANVSDTLRFTIWGLGWTQYSGDPVDERVSDYTEPGGLRFRVGIDPYGGESYTSTNIVWSEFYDPYDAWHPFELTATALSDVVSVWAYAHPDNPILRWNQTFWDDANLEIVTIP
jgi:hypothetical protein